MVPPAGPVVENRVAVEIEMKAREIAKPRPGFFKLRLIKGGPFVPARIFLPCPIDPEFGHPMDRSRHLIGEIDGKEVEVERIWLSAEEIGPAEFAFMTADASWCRNWAPAEPQANPRKPIDARTAPPAY